MHELFIIIKQTNTSTNKQQIQYQQHTVIILKRIHDDDEYCWDLNKWLVYFCLSNVFTITAEEQYDN